MTDKRIRRGLATILLFLASAALLLALAAFVSGGLSWRGAGIFVRDPWRPFLAGIVLVSVARVLVGAVGFRECAAVFVGSPGLRARRIALLASGCALVYATAWSSRAAGGSDSSCYVLQAEAFAHGHATLANPVAAQLPGMPNAVFAPTGFIPSPRVYGAAVPICGPGLSLAMAAAYLVHPSAVFVVVPLSAALLVWLTFVYGRRIDDDVTGAMGAVLMACSPIFLYQAVQPMSDVPAAAAWMLALTAASPFAAGLSASAAVLIRPNLAVLVLPLALKKRWLSPFFAKNGDSHRFLAGVVPGAVALLALNAARYGAPLATGYGSTDALFSAAHVSANLLRYPRWLLETHTPFVLLAPAAPWTLRRDRERASLAALSLAAAALLGATYLAYTVFDDWWYIRFLLPAIPTLLVLSVTVLRDAARRLARPVATASAVAVTMAMAIYYLHVAQARDALELQRLESRFALTGELARRELPADAVVLAVQQSGSIRFHGGRDILAWDAIAGDALDRTIDTLRQQGRPVYVALEDSELERYRARFAGQRGAELNERPLAELHGAANVRLYRLTR